MNDKLIHIKEDLQLRLIDFKSYLSYKLAAVKRYLRWLGHALLNKTHKTIAEIEDNTFIWSDALDEANEQFQELLDQYSDALQELESLKKKPKKTKK